MDIFSLLVALKIIMWLVIGISLVFLFFAVCSIYTNLTTGVPWAKIPKRNIYKIFEEINLPEGSLIYDLGAGDGRVLLVAEKFGLKPQGFELSLYPCLKAKIKIFFYRSRARIKRRDFFKENLNQADAIFIFLVSKTLTRVSQKLKQELKSGATVISYGFILPGWRLYQTILTKPSLTYIYRV
jgi:hypothetical protein